MNCCVIVIAEAGNPAGEDCNYLPESLTPAAHERRAFFSYSEPMAGDAPALPARRPGLLALEGGIVQHGTLRGAAVPAEGRLFRPVALHTPRQRDRKGHVILSRGDGEGSQNT